MKQFLAPENPSKKLKPSNQKNHDFLKSSLSSARSRFDLESVETLDEAKTCELKTLLRQGSTLDFWETPPEWLSGGIAKSHKKIDLRGRILNFLPVPLRAELEGRSRILLDRAALTLTHYLILLRMGPAAMGRGKGKELKPHSIRSIAYDYAARLFACALKTLDSSLQTDSDTRPSLAHYNGPLLINLDLNDSEVISYSARPHVLNECKRMYMLNAIGVWSDIPTLESELRSNVLLGPPRSNETPKPRDSHLPLPDDYLAALASRCLWLINDLAPNVFEISAELKVVWEKTSHRGWTTETRREKRRDAVAEALAQHSWLDSSGGVFEKPPFPLALPILKGFSKSSVEDDKGEARWPPQTYMDFLRLASLVQSAHLCVTFLCLAGRQSEVIDLQRDCVARAKDGRTYSNGRTFKLTQTFEGEQRDWQLPEVSTFAIEQQVRLTEMLEVIGNLRIELPNDTIHKQHLWIRTAVNRNAEDYMSPLLAVGQALIAFVKRIGLDVNPGGQRLRTHRFRKTVARLVGLALTQAPKLLMDIFGHKSLEMTLSYILTDKDLRAEIEIVTRELRVMRAKDVVEKMVESDAAMLDTDDVSLGGYGGLAAFSIRSAIQTHQERVHRRGDDWNANSVLELAELLTLQGQAWEQVRHGVLCTKLPGEAGPCNKSKGRPEPSKCASSCGHRLEQAFLRDDVDGSIADSVAAYEKANADEEYLTASHWAGQIRTHVPRFADLKAKWMANAVVQQVMGQSATTEVA